MSTLNVDKVDPSTGTTLELGTSGDTVNLGSGVTAGTGFGGDLSFGGDTFGANKVIGANDAYSFSLETSGNTALTIDANGQITKPLQPAFLAISNAENNVTGNGTVYTMLWEKSEPIDQNADFASGTFTAPVTGTYMFGVNMQMNSMSGMSYGTLKLVTSNRTYTHDTGAGVDGSEEGYTQYADMDASDTAYVTIAVGGLGGDTADIGVDSNFFGWLVA